MEALRLKGVLNVLKELPIGQHVISTRWVYDLKVDEMGIARLVTRGFRQIAGIDFDDTFSPVARFSSFRLLLALAVQLG
ncbi:Retrotransposon protein, Ty1-Copia subclass [Phytophthora megakarya]|uniref:Retrotransposon protein, Ty1-Copia subclass n=1 Tax=Phytophthora megakarya TaxID=4795 RepID=A0A225WEX9_9STRA|nr:Retrotransposon protein, Ty1-Copia subclass [Phytophthora megakarya]